MDQVLQILLIVHGVSKSFYYYSITIVQRRGKHDITQRVGDGSKKNSFAIVRSPYNRHQAGTIRNGILQRVDPSNF